MLQGSLPSFTTPLDRVILSWMAPQPPSLRRRCRKCFPCPFSLVPARSSEPHLDRWAVALLVSGAVLRDGHSKEWWKGAKLAGDAMGPKGEGVESQGEGGVREAMSSYHYKHFCLL